MGTYPQPRCWGRWQSCYSCVVGITSTSRPISGHYFPLIIVAIAAFANFIPEIVELIGNRPKYAGSYKVMTQSQVFIPQRGFFRLIHSASLSSSAGTLITTVLMGFLKTFSIRPEMTPTVKLFFSTRRNQISCSRVYSKEKEQE